MTASAMADSALSGVAEEAAVLELDAVSKHFGDTVAVDRVTIRARRGQVIGLLGHNGAGKTTLVRLIAGLLGPTSGSVRVHGRDPLQDGVWVRRRLGVLPSSQLVDLRLTARENLRFAASLFGVPEPGERIDALLREFGIADRADERVSTFSAGMKQRTALARVLLPEPEILLLDEPSAALDPLGARELREIIRSSTRTGGRTVLICTHDLNEASDLCDEVFILGRGKVLAAGPPEELAARATTSAAVALTVDPADVEAARGVVRRAAVPAPQTGSATFLAEGLDPAGTARLVAALVSDGVRVHAVEPRRNTLADMYFSVHADSDRNDGEIS